MSALAEALVAAQRRALASLEKAFIAERIDSEAFHIQLHAMGITDDIDIGYLATSLAVMREWGASPPAETNGNEPRKASDAQVALIVDLLKRGNHAPLSEADIRSLPLERASALITDLKLGRYDPAKWDVPF